MITGITYGALITRKQDMHGGDAGNFMENHEHRVKNGVAMESSRGRMGSTLVFCMTS